MVVNISIQASVPGGYKPQEYTAAIVLTQPVWADKPDVKDVLFNKPVNIQWGALFYFPLPSSL